jgi:hypothetical protein
MRISIAAALWALSAVPALADDAPFLGTDPASVMAAGDKSLQQWFSFAHGHSGESFSAIQTQTEFDYGVSDRLQVGLSLIYDWSRTRPPGEAASTTSLAGLQGEAIWSVLATDKSPLGVAIAVDPAFDASSRGIAFRLLLTKYFAHFENILDINFENNWAKDETGHWQSSSAIIFNYGLAHPINAHWTIGLEVGNEFAFDNLLTSADLGSSAATFFAGPTVQYDFGTGTIGLGIQTQLPFASGAHCAGAYTADAERWRVGFRYARAI